MPGPPEAVENYPEVKSRKAVAWLPKKLRSGSWAWLRTLHYEEHIYYSHFGEKWVDAGYFTPDEYIMQKLRGEF